MKKTIFLFIACVTIFAMTIFAIGRCEGYSANKARIAELEQKIAQLESSDTEGSSTTETSASNQSEKVSQSKSSTNSVNESMRVGTYQITDKTNNTWILTIKADKTATIGKKGSNQVAYGSFQFHSPSSGYIYRFDYDEAPILWFQSGEKRATQITVKNGYFYSDIDAASANHPHKRLQLIKIK